MLSITTITIIATIGILANITGIISLIDLPFIDKAIEWSNKKRRGGSDTTQAIPLQDTIKNQVSVYKDNILYGFYEGYINLMKSSFETRIKTDKLERLEKLGFTSSTDYTYDMTDKEEIFIEDVLYYEKKYPNNLFIPDKLIRDKKFIKDEKLNIDIITPQEYKHSVPDDSMMQIETFKKDIFDSQLQVNSGLLNENYKIVDFSLDDIKTILNYTSANKYIFNKNIDMIYNKHRFLNNKYLTEKMSNDLNTLFGKEYLGGIIKTLQENILLIYDKNTSDKKFTYKEFVENIKNPNEFINVLYLEKVRNGYLVVTGW